MFNIKIFLLYQYAKKDSPFPMISLRSISGRGVFFITKFKMTDIAVFYNFFSYASGITGSTNLVNLSSDSCQPK